MAIPARVVLDLRMPALITLPDVAAHGRRAAAGDRPHDTFLLIGQIHKLRTVRTKDIGQVRATYRRPNGIHSLLLRRSGPWQTFEVVDRTLGVLEVGPRDVGVDLGRTKAAMSKQGLDDPDVHAFLQKMCGKGVA